MGLSKIYHRPFDVGLHRLVDVGDILCSFVTLSTVQRTPTAVFQPAAATGTPALLLPVILAQPLYSTYAHRA